MTELWNCFIFWLIDLVDNRTFGAARSSAWPAFRKRYEKIEPKKCKVCGDDRSELHHILPFHKDPSREMDSTNVIWLCDGAGTLEHHRGLGHLGNFRSWNAEIEVDARILHDKIMHRPL